MIAIGKAKGFVCRGGPLAGMVTAASWGEAIELDVFHVVELVDGEDGRFKGNFVAYTGILSESPELGPPSIGVSVFVASRRVSLLRSMGVAGTFKLLVCSDLCVPKFFPSIVLCMPSCPEVFNYLFSKLDRSATRSS